MYDLLIVGAGPCGLAAAIAAQRAGLRYLVIEKGTAADSLTRYPVYMTFFSSSENLAIGGVPFICSGEKPTRREALKYYQTLAQQYGLRVNMYEKVEVAVPVAGGGFELRTRKRDGSTARYQGRHLAVATGYLHHPNQLNIPGEDLPKVSHWYTEPFPYFGQRVLVVGGTNSAAETAIDLMHHGAEVTLVHRGSDLSGRVKPWVQPAIRSALNKGQIKAYWNSRVTAIYPDRVSVQVGAQPADNGDGGLREPRVLDLPNDFVLLLTGYSPDHSLIRSLGVTVNGETGVPEHNPETMETNVPGLFLAGVVSAGFDANKVFIENGREHGDKIAAAILAR